MQTFLWRRQRNYNVTVALVNAYVDYRGVSFSFCSWLCYYESRGRCHYTSFAADKSLFSHVYITLDDNALYGFNIQESHKLKALVDKLGLYVCWCWTDLHTTLART